MLAWNHQWQQTNSLSTFLTNEKKLKKSLFPGFFTFAKPKMRVVAFSDCWSQFPECGRVLRVVDSCQPASASEP